jgi:transposase
MNRDQFWLTDAQISKIAPHSPTDTPGKARVDDRRVISGTVHVLNSGGRWIDAPPEYGPKKTLYNRYVRWAAKGCVGRPVPRARTSRWATCAGSG